MTTTTSSPPPSSTPPRRNDHKVATMEDKSLSSVIITPPQKQPPTVPLYQLVAEELDDLPDEVNFVDNDCKSVSKQEVERVIDKLYEKEYEEMYRNIQQDIDRDVDRHIQEFTTNLERPYEFSEPSHPEMYFSSELDFSSEYCIYGATCTQINDDYERIMAQYSSK